MKFKFLEVQEGVESKSGKFGEVLEKNIGVKQGLDQMREQGERRVGDLEEVIRVLEREIAGVEEEGRRVEERWGELEERESERGDGVGEE